MIYVGIDPGVHGAIAYLHGRHGKPAVRNLPTRPRGVGKQLELDPHALLLLTQGWADMDNVYCAIERQQVIPRNGALSGFRMGETYGMLRMAATAAGWAVELVPPKVWQKAMQTNAKKRADRKKRALSIAQDRWPTVTFDTADQAEAALIAEYGRRTKE